MLPSRESTSTEGGLNEMNTSGPSQVVKRKETSSFLLRHFSRLFATNLALDFAKPEGRRLCPATEARPSPKTKPRAIRQHFIVSSIGSRDVACAQWPDIWRFENFL